MSLFHQSEQKATGMTVSQPGVQRFSGLYLVAQVRGINAAGDNILLFDTLSVRFIGPLQTCQVDSGLPLILNGHQ